MIYLDNSATTKPDPSVLQSFQHVSEQLYANPSSIHRFGGEAERLLQKARGQAARLLDVHEEEIIFTSGGTEGNNMAIKGIALAHQGRGKHIITSEIEHPSVYGACKSLEKFGFEITCLPVDENGVVSITELERAIRHDTILISIMHVHNELGTIQPIEQIGAIADKYPKLFFHVDGVQGLGKVPLQLMKSGIDLCTFSGHKIHGLKGTGILYVRNGTTLFPLFHGGDQENRLRSGTENVAGSVSFVKALRLIKEREKNETGHLHKLIHYLRTGLAAIEDVQIHTPKLAAPHIMSISVPALKPEVLIHILGEHDIYISTKSACSSKQTDESRTHTAIGLNSESAISALRISLSYDTTEEEINVFIEALKQAILQLKEALE